MKIAEVIGTVTLSRCHASFQGARLKLLTPLAVTDLGETTAPRNDEIVAWDQLGTGIGSRVALAEGPEAAQPFRPDIKPLDAYVAALLDEVNIDPKSLNSLNLNQ